MLGSRPIGPLLWRTCSQTRLSVGVYGIYALSNAWFITMRQLGISQRLQPIVCYNVGLGQYGRVLRVRSLSLMDSREPDTSPAGGRPRA